MNVPIAKKSFVVPETSKFYKTLPMFFIQISGSCAPPAQGASLKSYCAAVILSSHDVIRSSSSSPAAVPAQGWLVARTLLSPGIYLLLALALALPFA